MTNRYESNGEKILGFYKTEKLRSHDFFLEGYESVCKDLDLKSSGKSVEERNQWSSGGFVKISQHMRDSIDIEIDFNDGAAVIKEESMEILRSAHELRRGYDGQILNYKATFSNSFSIGIEIYPKFTYLGASKLLDQHMRSISVIVNQGLEYFETHNVDYILGNMYLLVSVENKNRLEYIIEHTSVKRMSLATRNSIVHIKKNRGF